MCKGKCPGNVHIQAIRWPHQEKEDQHTEGSKTQPFKMTGTILYGKKFLPEKSSVSRYFPSILYSMTRSNSFLHPALGKNASFSDIIFVAIQVLTLKFQASLSLPWPDLTSKQAASRILPEGSLRKNQGKQWASSGTSFSLLQLHRPHKTHAAIFSSQPLFYGYANFLTGPIQWWQCTDARSPSPAALSMLHWLTKSFPIWYTATADTHKVFTELRNYVFKNIFARVLKAASWYSKQGKCIYK